MLYRLGGNQSCLESLPHTTIKPLSDDDFALMRLAPEIVPDICVDGTLIRSSQGREVYMMLSDRKRSFPNGDIFASMGLSFENVVVVSDWFVQTIPDGPSFWRSTDWYPHYASTGAILHHCCYLWFCFACLVVGGSWLLHLSNFSQLLLDG